METAQGRKLKKKKKNFAICCLVDLGSINSHFFHILSALSHLHALILIACFFVCLLLFVSISSLLLRTCQAYFNFITLKDLFSLLGSCFSTHPKSKLPLPLAPFLMLRHQYGTLYLLTYVTLYLFIHSSLNSKPTFSHLNSFTHSI